jgi:hypothetical protein
MGHDPQRAAGAYLGGELGRRQRERFEAHLLACEACWGEVQAARQGRALAESAREVAPQHLRDRVRATIDATPAGRRSWAVRWAPLAAVTLAAVVVGGLLIVERQPAQPAAIVAAVASYQADAGAWSGQVGPSRVRQLGDRGRRGGAVLRRPSHAVAGGRPGPRHGAVGRGPSRPGHPRACGHAMRSHHRYPTAVRGNHRAARLAGADRRAEPVGADLPSEEALDG